MKAENERLSFAELRHANVQRCEKWHPGGLSEWSLSDWFTATLGELGEAANVAKKLNRVRDGMVGNSESEAELRTMLADEIADVAIYLDILAASEGVDLASAIVSKFNRTSIKVGFPDRLPDGTHCEHCGTPDHLARSEGCPPPFDPQPHAFNGKHPAAALLAQREEKP